MTKRIGALALLLAMLALPLSPACAERLGPAKSYEELLSLVASASQGDILLVSGDIAASHDRPLTTGFSLHIEGDGAATISSLALRDASVVFADIALAGGLRIEGDSHVQLLRGVTVVGAPGRSGIDFTGSGALLLDPGSAVTGGGGATGVNIRHTGGDLYISFDGSIRGGAGQTGGAAAVIDPLGSSGALMITGALTGGEGEAFGGNALNLHNLSGNAYITVDGRLSGGEGNIGGSGLQLITADGSVSAGIGGQITGGYGHSYGGDALLLMNVSGSSSVSLWGQITGGNARGTSSTPGQSLKLLGQSTSLLTRIGDCILQDGYQILTSGDVTPLPAITSSVDDAAALLTPAPTPLPTIEAAPAPSVEPSATPELTPAPTQAPTEEPTAEPTSEPTAEPTSEPTPEPTIEPSPAPVN